MKQGEGMLLEAGIDLHLHQKPDSFLVCSERMDLEENTWVMNAES